jgi:hypothetical protein
MSATLVKIKDGIYRNKKINGTFSLIKPHWTSPSTQKTFVQVNLTEEFKGKKLVNKPKAAEAYGVPSVCTVRITVPKVANLEYLSVDSKGKTSKEDASAVIAAAAPEAQLKGKYKEAEAEEIMDDIEGETKKEALVRIRQRFDTLDMLTGAVIEANIRALVVTGPPGIGKSYGVERELDFEDTPAYVGNRGRKSEIVKGSISPIGLYQTLFKHSDKGDIVVFDDCDRIFGDEICLNMLKAVTDSGDHRRVAWKSESHILDKADCPDHFEFNGGIIFITNIKLDQGREGSKIADHLAALVSRCHFLDLGVDDTRDIFLRVEQIVEDGMLKDYKLTKKEEAEIVLFMRKHSHRLRELSLRTVLKIAQLMKITDDWQELAIETCCMPNGRGRRIAA